MHNKKNAFKKIFFLILALFLFIFLVFEALIIYAGKKDYEDAKYDYIIVLGAKVNDDNVSLALKYRLDAAYNYARDNKDIKIVVSGGQGSDEKYPESTVMKNYLLEKGIESDKIIEENKSTSTFENFAYSHDITGDAKILIATNDFHMFRSLFLAKKNSFDAQPLNAKTPDIIKIKMYIREFPAFIISCIFNM